MTWPTVPKVRCQNCGRLRAKSACWHSTDPALGGWRCNATVACEAARKARDV